jgi:hypothetical protein
MIAPPVLSGRRWCAAPPALGGQIFHILTAQVHSLACERMRGCAQIAAGLLITRT